MRSRTSQVKQPAAVKRRNLWDPESVVKAMNNAILGKMGVNKAAEQYDIPATTLKDRISWRMKYGVKPGPQGLLTLEEDQELTEFLIDCCKMGNEKTKRELLQFGKRLVEKKREKEGLNLTVKGGGIDLWNDILNCPCRPQFPSQIVGSMQLLSLQ